MTKSHNKKEFIPALEGMRALAVVAVLLFHLDFLSFQGGFLGVDLFFVISGFIITRNLLLDTEQRRFTYGNFYLRRYRRLIPALIVTVALTMWVATAIIPPDDLALAARSAIFSLFSLGNINFWLESGYFDSSAATKPLLHTWSLSVEEQFYLLWPALLALALRLRREMGVALSLLFASLSVSLYFTTTEPEAVFYLLPFRVHQFMAGAIIAITGMSLTGRPGSTLTILASCTLLCSFVLVSETTSPFTSAVLVSFAGWMLIATRSSPIAITLFGNAVMQWIGTRSYALYLTHWPLIVLYKYGSGFELSLAAQVVLGIGSILSAIALHELVEKPFRLQGPDNTVFKKHAISITTVALALTAGTSLSLWRLDGLPKRESGEVAALAAKAKKGGTQRFFRIRTNTCHLTETSNVKDYDPVRCAASGPGYPNILVLGDSLAADIYMMLAETYPGANISQATAAGCPPLLSQRPGIYDACEDLNTLRLSQNFLADKDLVVMAADWKKSHYDSLRETVEHLANLGKPVTVIGPRIKFIEKADLLIHQQHSLEDINERLSPVADRRPGVLDELRDALPNTEVVDFVALQCRPDCDMVINGEVIYADRHHLTLVGARILGKRLHETATFDQYLHLEPNDSQPPDRVDNLTN